VTDIDIWHDETELIGSKVYFKAKMMHIEVSDLLFSKRRKLVIQQE